MPYKNKFEKTRDNIKYLQSAIYIGFDKSKRDFTFPEFKFKDWIEFLLDSWLCPRCGAKVYLKCIGGYLDNPWGFWVECENKTFGFRYKCNYEQYYDNLRYNESKARYSGDGMRLG